MFVQEINGTLIVFTGIFISEKHTSCDHVIWECAFKNQQVTTEEKNNMSLPDLHVFLFFIFFPLEI